MFSSRTLIATIAIIASSSAIPVASVSNGIIRRAWTQEDPKQSIEEHIRNLRELDASPECIAETIAVGFQLLADYDASEPELTASDCEGAGGKVFDLRLEGTCEGVPTIACAGKSCTVKDIELDEDSYPGCDLTVISGAFSPRTYGAAAALFLSAVALLN